LKTILITGSSGFIGKNIFKSLQNKFKIIKISLKKKKLKITEKKIYTLIHCAAVMPSYYPMKKIYEINDSINKKLIKICINNKIEKIIYLSSCLVYAETKDKIVDEYSRISKRNLYAKSKYKFEQILQEFSKRSESNVICLRLPAVIGLGCHGNLFSRLIAFFLNNQKEIKLYKLNSAYNNCIHIDTLVKFIKTLIKNYNNKFDIINLSSSHPLKLRDIIEMLKKKFNFKSEIFEMTSNKNSFLINSNKAVKKYDFNRIKTISTIRKYLKQI
jgi:nucleoside-diphosphate-sugar epimerase